MDTKKTIAAAGLSGIAGVAAGAAATTAVNHASSDKEETEEKTDENTDKPEEDKTDEAQNQASASHGSHDYAAQQHTAHQETHTVHTEKEHLEEGSAENHVASEGAHEVHTANTISGGEQHDDDGEVHVVGYQTETLDDGHQVDVAYVSDGQTNGMIIDVDQDGEADVLAVDLNHNNDIEENEVMDVRGQDIAMAPYEHEADLASNNQVHHDESEVQVIGTETVHTDDGGDVNVAYLSDGETNGLIADVDQDGSADVMAIDVNHNEHFEQDEIYDVSENNIGMPDAYDDTATGGDDYMASQPDDYVNNADVDTYMV